jgi:hypothetical protein
MEQRSLEPSSPKPKDDKTPEEVFRQVLDGKGTNHTGALEAFKSKKFPLTDIEEAKILGSSPKPKSNQKKEDGRQPELF